MLFSQCRTPYMPPVVAVSRLVQSRFVFPGALISWVLDVDNEALVAVVRIALLQRVLQLYCTGLIDLFPPEEIQPVQ